MIGHHIHTHKIFCVYLILGYNLCMSTNIEVRNIVTVSTASIPVWNLWNFRMNDIVNYLWKLYINTTWVNTASNPIIDTTNWSTYTEIDDNQSSTTKTYSSSKIDTLIANIPQWSGSSKILYLTSTEVFTGYDLLSDVPQTSGEVQESVTVSNAEWLIDSYATEALNITNIPAGNWSFTVWANADNLSGVSNIIARVYKRTSAWIETLLFEEQSLEITSTTYQELTFEYIQATPITVLKTDRIVVKFYGNTTRNSPTIISIFHGSPDRYSHIHTTIPSVYVVTTIANETPSWTINGSNVNFSLAHSPILTTEKLYLNWMRLKITDDYTLSSNIITLLYPPTPWETLLIDYNY